MVGCRNAQIQLEAPIVILSGIPMVGCRNCLTGRCTLWQFYQAFRWWGVGTMLVWYHLLGNFIRHSDGGVSEPYEASLPRE